MCNSTDHVDNFVKIILIRVFSVLLNINNFIRYREIKSVAPAAFIFVPNTYDTSDCSDASLIH